MSTNKYYLDELTYLREAGSEFAKFNPKLTQFLSEDSSDPDVERLLEGFAFLTGRIRQKLDDEIPEMTQSLMSLLWPHYMRSIPSMCITQLTPSHGAITEKTTIEHGMEMASEPIEGTQCLFRTCYDVDLYPLEIQSIEQVSSRSSSTVNIRFSTYQGLDLSRIGLDTLRLHIHGDLRATRMTYVWLFNYLEYMVIDVGDGYKHTLEADKLQPVGYGEEDIVIPYSSNSFSGYRLLQELFALPEKFMFADVQGLEWLQGIPQRTEFTLSFVFSRALPDEVMLSEKNIRLHCTPAINLFEKDADPIRLSHKKSDYRVRPQSDKQEHYEVYAIEKVESWSKKKRGTKTILPFESFDHQITQVDKREFYKSSIRENVNGRGLEQYISFHTHDGDIAQLEIETVLMKLVCSNAQLAERLSIGDIVHATYKSSTLVTFTNLTKPTQSVSPQLDGELHWQLISNMSLNYISLSNIEVLKVILSTYDFHSRVNRQAHRVAMHRLEGIKNSSIRPVDRVYRGVSVRGNQIRLVLDSAYFVNEGDMYLLACVINEFIRLYSSVNSFTELEVLDEKNGEVYWWKNAIGQQAIL